MARQPGSWRVGPATSCKAASTASAWPSRAWKRAKMKSSVIKPPLRTRPDHRERDTLRIGRLDDPAAARHLLRAHEMLAAAGLDPTEGRIDIIDRDIEEPGGRNGRIVHHAAQLHAVAGEE